MSGDGMERGREGRERKRSEKEKRRGGKARRARAGPPLLFDFEWDGGERRSEMNLAKNIMCSTNLMNLVKLTNLMNLVKFG